MTARVFLGLGSNMGDREKNLDAALAALGRRGVRTVRRSSLYETEPFGGPPQGWFLNAAALAETALTPEATLQAALDVEEELGRVRTVPNGPRGIDIDLLFYGDEVRNGPVLTLPHPRLHERLFVLVPLSDLAPDLRHPVLGLTVGELRALSKDTSRVLPYAGRNLPS